MPVNPLLDAELTKLFAGFKLPALDVEAILATQRRNIDALTKANQLAVEGLQTLARRQAEILRGGIEQASALLRELGQQQTPADRVARQAEAAKAGIEQSLAHARELAEIVARSSSEAFDVLSRRLGEGLDEVRELATGSAALH